MAGFPAKTQNITGEDKTEPVACNLQSYCSEACISLHPLTSFNGVSRGHVGLFIFHNSPGSSGWPCALTLSPLSHTHARTNHRRRQSQSVLISTRRHLTQKIMHDSSGSYHLLVVLAPRPTEAFENMHSHVASFLPLQRVPKLGSHPLTISASPL